jgi:hypothetical protein
MSVVKYRDTEGGQVPDVSPHEHKINEYVAAINYRGQNRAMQKIGGHETEVISMPITDPDLLTAWNPPGDSRFIVSALAGAAFRSIVNTAPNTATAISTQMANTYVNVFSNAAIGNTTKWSSAQLGGGSIIILTNGEITPKYASEYTNYNLQSLPNWDVANSNTVTSGTVVATAFNKIFVGNIKLLDTSSNVITYQPNFIKVSSASNNIDPAIPPETFTPSAINAEQFGQIVELPVDEPVVGLIPSRDSLLAFTTNQCFQLTENQSTARIQVSPLSSVRGLLTARSAVYVDGRTYFITTDDICVTNGSTLGFTSLAANTYRNYFFQQRLNTTYAYNVFGIYNRYYNEVVWYYPNKNSAGPCNEAVILNLQTNTFTQIDVPECKDAYYGGSYGNNGVNRPFTGYTSAYNRVHTQYGNVLYVHDTGFSYLGTANITTTLSKVYDFEQEGSNSSVIKKINSLFPIFYGNTVATFSMIASDLPFVTQPDFANTSYTGEFYTTINYKIDQYQPGRFVAIQIVTSDQVYHSFNSMNIDVEILGLTG